MLKTSILFVLYSFSFIGFFNAFSQDTIPFTLGKDYRIYIKVQVNDAPDLDFIFDTGADGMVVNTTQTDKKLNLNFDKSTENIGANGVSTIKVSSGNNLKIGTFELNNTDVLGIPYPEKYYSFDGVIGYLFFEGKYIEIDYKTRNLVIHDVKESVSKIEDYTFLEAKMIDNVAFIEMSLEDETESIPFRAMIDTGFNNELIVYHSVVSSKQLDGRFPVVGSSRSEGTDGTIIRSDQVRIPKAKIGNTEVIHFLASFNKTPTNTNFPAILGGKLLKEFHWIINFQKREVFVKANVDN